MASAAAKAVMTSLKNQADVVGCAKMFPLTVCR